MFKSKYLVLNVAHVLPVMPIMIRVDTVTRICQGGQTRTGSQTSIVHLEDGSVFEVDCPQDALMGKVSQLNGGAVHV
jgi:hypothetical protein